jgi:lipopolysaccharide/colanic/teichoic acid biosynthesis glycosyltransferase
MDVVPRQVSIPVLDGRSEVRLLVERSHRMPSVQLLIASLILVVTAPIMVLACLLVRLTSRGPVLYSQARLGLGGRCFTIYKIRTMYHESEPDGPVWSVRGDRRVTPVGWFLRWTHIDELPQLINILRGDMDLMGPRPERPEIVAMLERALPEYHRRLQVRPGLTGLAQVLRGPDTDLNSVCQKLDLDLYYLDHKGPWIDLRIILATVPHLLRIPSNVIARCFGFPSDLVRIPSREDVTVAAGLQVPKVVSEPCSAG